MKVLRTDVGAHVTGTMTNIRRADGCHCFAGKGELAGQDECKCTTVVDGVGGPKFVASREDDRAAALRDFNERHGHATSSNEDAGETPIERAKREMNQRHQDAWKTTPARPHADAQPNESPVEKAQREMRERNQNAWKK